MDTFGDRLKSEREDRGLSIEAVAELLRVDHDRLRALERNDFEALPGEAVMMECLHAYAQCLEVDAELMIADYVRERDGRRQRAEQAEVEEAAEAAPAAILSEAARRPRFSPWLLAIAALVLLAAWWMLSRDAAAPAPERSATTAPVEPQPLSLKAPAEAAPAPMEAEEVAPPTGELAVGAPTAEEPAQVAPTPLETAEVSPAPAEPAATAPTAVESATARSASAPLTRITGYGVGTAVEEHELVGRSDRFSEGAQVWFWTWVQGGASGDRIVHVWLREGVEVARISLEIGGASWRTSSTKTLQVGAAGSWAAEARDREGRVLARSEFVCVR